MQEDGITREDALKKLNTELLSGSGPDVLILDKMPYDSYMEKYNQIYGEKIDEIRNGGYHIYTSLDSKIQRKLQESVDGVLEGFEELQEDGRFAMQGAAAIADNQSGYIVAIVGGRGTSDQYNRAILAQDSRDHRLSL